MGNIVNKSTVSAENFRHYQLINYCQLGLLDKLHYLHIDNPDIDLSKNNEEALRTACKAGDIYVIRQLIEWKPDIDISANDWEGLKSAIMFGHLEIIKFYFERDYSIKPLDYVGTALHYHTIKFLYIMEEKRKNLYWITELKMNCSHIECPICQNQTEKIINTPCNHSFCEKCIKTWLTYNQSCPYCRRVFNLEIEADKNVVS